MSIMSRNIILMILMIGASVLGVGLRPTHKIADQGPAIDLKTMVPLSFGDWKEDIQTMSLVVDPGQSALIKKLYSQTLSRTYINSAGYRIMLSLAYGRDQSDGLQLHKPEVCYPAQGFQVQKKWDEELHLEQGMIPVRRIETTFGSNRFEPITYWTLVGKTVVLGEAEKKWVQLHYSFKGQIPDGMLFRVSSIDPDSASAFKYQNIFISDLLKSITPDARKNLSGL